MIKALLFGSIGVLAETSEIQRQAYNQALREAGLGWQWDAATYRELLMTVGGKNRLSLLGRATGSPLPQATIDQVHARKTEIATGKIRQQHTPLRPGVEAAIRLAKARGMRLGFVTSTYRPNIDAIIDANRKVLSPETFDVIVTKGDVRHGKPNPEPYRFALSRLNLAPAEAVAIEDTEASLQSAQRAGIATIATPGAFAMGQDFYTADLVLEALGGETDLAPGVLTMLGVTP